MNELTTEQAAPNAMSDPGQFAHVCDVAALMVDSQMLPAHLQGRLSGGKMVEKFSRQKQYSLQL